MAETVGTVALKIARLQQHLQLMQHQHQLGKAYPQFQAELLRRQLLVEHQLGQLLHLSQELQNVIQTYPQEVFHGELAGQDPFCPVN